MIDIFVCLIPTSLIGSVQHNWTYNQFVGLRVHPVLWVTYMRISCHKNFAWQKRGREKLRTAPQNVAIGRRSRRRGRRHWPPQSSPWPSPLAVAVVAVAVGIARRIFSGRRLTKIVFSN